MYSFSAIIKLTIFTVVALACLWLFLHLGGLWLTGGAQGYVVIYKTPHFNGIMTVNENPARPPGLTSSEAYLERHVRAIIEVRENNGFKDIAVMRYAALAVAFICLVCALRTTRRNRKRRYFKSFNSYDIDKLKF